MSTFDHGSHFRAFASKVAYLKTMEALRKNRRQQWLIFDSEVIEKIQDYYNTQPEAAGKDQSALRSCLKKLKPEQRTLIHQRYTLGETIRKIARTSKQTENALQQTFFRIRNTLKSCISQQLSDLP